MVEVESRRGRIRVAARVGDIIPGPRLHPVPLRQLGRPRPPPGRQRADDHRVGRGEQAAPLQVRGRRALARSRWRPGPATWPRARRPRGRLGRRSRPKDVVKSEEAAADGQDARRQLPRPGPAERAAPRRVVPGRRGHHGHEPDVLQMTRLMASWSEENAGGPGPARRPVRGRSRRKSPETSTRPSSTAPGAAASASSATSTTSGSWRRRSTLAYELLTQAAAPCATRRWKTILGRASGMTRRQAGWLRTRIDQAAPQALVVPV